MVDFSRKYEFDLIRIFGILMVLLNHKDIYIIYKNFEAYSFTFVLFSALSILIKTGPPLFLMVSGALLLEKEETIEVIMKHRVVRMVIVLILIAVSMRIFGMSESIVDAILYDANWYIYSYIGYLLMLPFLRKMTKSVSEEMEIYYLFVAGLLFSIQGLLIAINVRPAILGYIGIFTTDWAPNVYNIIFPVGGCSCIDCITDSIAV